MLSMCVVTGRANQQPDERKPELKRTCVKCLVRRKFDTVRATQITHLRSCLSTLWLCVHQHVMSVCPKPGT